MSGLVLGHGSLSLGGMRLGTPRSGARPFGVWMFANGTLDVDGRVQSRRSFSSWMFAHGFLWSHGIVDNTRAF